MERRDEWVRPLLLDNFFPARFAYDTYKLDAIFMHAHPYYVLCNASARSLNSEVSLMVSERAEASTKNYSTLVIEEFMTITSRRLISPQTSFLNAEYFTREERLPK
jgi:hypothetical protein